jgi:hypothetical protein
MTAIRPGGQDPIDRLAGFLDRLEATASASERSARIDSANRIGLLFGHGLFAILVAPGFALLAKTGMTSASFTLMRKIPGSPWSMAILIGVSGMVLAIATWHRNRRWEYASLAALGLWYTIVAVSFTGAIAVWLSDSTAGELDWSRSPSFYAPVVYFHLMFVMAGHMRTLRRKGLHRPARSSEKDAP